MSFPADGDCNLIARVSGHAAASGQTASAFLSAVVERALAISPMGWQGLELLAGLTDQRCVETLKTGDLETCWLSRHHSCDSNLAIAIEQTLATGFIEVRPIGFALTEQGRRRILVPLGGP